MRVRRVRSARAAIVALVVAVGGLSLRCNSETDNCSSSQTKVCLADGTTCTCAPACSNPQDCLAYSLCVNGACGSCYYSATTQQGCACFDNICLPQTWTSGQTVVFQPTGTTGSGSSSGSSSSANYPCDPPASPGLVCGLPNGATHAFYSCTQQSDCVSGTVCIDNDGDHAYYCKPLCTTSAGECEGFVSINQCTPGAGGGGACQIARCPNGLSSGIGVCEGPGSTLPPSFTGSSCCP
jgi:hypothetical protein